jgi:lipid II:glycine glycyltransferase (peptidoglycan interpeptide bridge formation enzyme)
MEKKLLKLTVFKNIFDKNQSKECISVNFLSRKELDDFIKIHEKTWRKNIPGFEIKID